MTPPEATSSAKQTFLDTYDQEHARTMRVLRAYPSGQLDLRPHPKLKSARELAWVFTSERRFGTAVFQERLTELMSAPAPAPPDSWEELLAAIDKEHAEFREMIRATSDDQMIRAVPFFTGPKTMGTVTRTQLVWMLLHDEIHHRGQFTVYLRMAEGKVPSVYGPTADEPWM